MTIIKDTPESNCAYVSQSWEGDTVPEGYIAIPDELLPVWEQYKPFMTIDINDGVITAMENNSEARAAWEAAAVADQAEAKIAEQIVQCKSELATSDYKLIKCCEYGLAGTEMPYDITALHQERQAIRDQINLLEAKT